MAVYTKVSREELENFLGGYDVGKLLSFEGIEQGVENTNYHVFTEKDRYILTLFEKRVDPADIPFFFDFTSHLSKSGIACPWTVSDKEGKFVGSLCGKPAALISFLAGKGLETSGISVSHCSQLGLALARMHCAAETFPLKRKNSVTLKEWKELAAKTRDRADEVEKGLASFVEEELLWLERNWPSGLPQAVVHADVFPDNVFFDNGNFAGVIDFYFSCTDFLAYDLALVINAWCFDMEWCFVPERLDALLSSYESVRPLTEDESKVLETLCRGAAMRILMTRLHDWVFHPSGAIVTPKNPAEYISKLRFHQQGGMFQNGLKLAACR